MPRKIVNALTPLAVKNAKPGRHADGGGLYVLVKESGARSWLYRATIAGKVRGNPRSDLRRRTQEAKATAQAAKVSRSSFRMVAEAYVALHEDSWRNDKHRAQWRATLAAYAYPHFSDMAVACSPYCLIDGTRSQPILL